MAQWLELWLFYQGLFVSYMEMVALDVDGAGAGAGSWVALKSRLVPRVRCMQCGPVALGCKAIPFAACVCTDVCTQRGHITGKR
jgi:hypothetical protein